MIQCHTFTEQKHVGQAYQEYGRGDGPHTHPAFIRTSCRVRRHCACTVNRGIEVAAVTGDALRIGGWDREQAWVRHPGTLVSHFLCVRACISVRGGVRVLPQPVDPSAVLLGMGA